LVPVLDLMEVAFGAEPRAPVDLVEGKQRDLPLVGPTVCQV
jgi:hypothetical protein